MQAAHGAGGERSDLAKNDFNSTAEQRISNSQSHHLVPRLSENKAKIRWWNSQTCWKQLASAAIHSTANMRGCFGDLTQLYPYWV